MLSVELQLYAIIALIYVSDCLWWLPRTSWYLTGNPEGGRMRAFFAGPLGNANGGFRLLCLLPGYRTTFELREWPFSVSSAGWTSFVPEVLSGHGRPLASNGFASFDKTMDPPGVDGTFVYAPGQNVRADARGACAARAACAFLADLRELQATDRDAAIDKHWQEGVDATQIRARAKEAVQASRLCQTTGQFQFLAMFVLSPVFVILHGTLGLLLAIALLLTGAAANGFAFFHGHRKLYPEARGERWRSALLMVISFPMSARSVDILTRKALLGFQAPAVIASLCRPDAQNRELLHHWYRDLHHPLSFGLEDEAARTAAGEYQTKRLERWQVWWNGQLSDEWRLPREIEKLPSRSYCPRCLTDYDADASHCPDCPGAVLTPYESLEHNG